MSYLYKFTVNSPHEFPGATFTAHNPIPISECQRFDGSPTTIELIALRAETFVKAHTILNGKIYTDLTEAQMSGHCALNYAPQT